MGEENDILADFSVEALKSGDERAFDAFFFHHYHSFCFFAKRLLKDRFAAEEIVEDSFIKYWQRHPDFDDLNSIKSFLYITIRNACINFIKTRETRAYHEASFSIQAGGSEAVLIEEIIRAETLQHIYQAIEELPAQCRSVLKLMYEEGLKSKEIAATLKIAVSTVDNHKARGIKLLKSRLSALRLFFVVFPAVIMFVF